MKVLKIINNGNETTVKIDKGNEVLFEETIFDMLNDDKNTKTFRINNDGGFIVFPSLFLKNSIIKIE